tara:strand:- start:389 stop:1042 length:654 start_codon:yes stop_codon:yes gene_type:complete
MVRPGNPHDQDIQDPAPVDAEEVEEFRGIIPIAREYAERALDYTPRQFGNHIKDLGRWSIQPGRKKWTIGALVGIAALTLGANWELSHRTNAGAVSLNGEIYTINHTDRPLGFDTYFVCHDGEVKGSQDCLPLERDLGDLLATVLWTDGDEVLKGPSLRIADYCEDFILNGYATDTVTMDGVLVPRSSVNNYFNCDILYAEFGSKSWEDKLQFTLGL